MRAVAGQSGITWLEPTGAGKSWQEAVDARSRVENAIRSEAYRLANVDYASLSLPDFMASTRALLLMAGDFTGQPLSVEAFGTGKNGEKWTLYAGRDRRYLNTQTALLYTAGYRLTPCMTWMRAKSRSSWRRYGAKCMNSPKSMVRVRWTTDDGR